MLLVAIGKPSPGDPPEEGEKLGFAGKAPPPLAKTAQNISEYRLHDVSRVDLDPKLTAQSTPDDDPQVGLIGAKDRLYGLGVPVTQPLDPVLERMGADESLLCVARTGFRSGDGSPIGG